MESAGTELTPLSFTQQMDALQVIAPRAWLMEYENRIANNTVESELLGQAPFAIYLLAQVLLISTRRGNDVRDFELNVPTNGFQYLRYTRLRSAVVQVAHEGHHAFFVAHSNVDQIRMMASQIPNTVDRIIYILDAGSPHEVNAYLPNELNRVMQISTECATLAEAIVHGFVRVGNVTKELVRACEDTKGTQEREFDRVMQQLEEAKEKERFLREKEARFKKMVDESRDSVRRFEDEYREALRSQPTAGQLFLAKLGDGITELLPIVTQGIMTKMGAMDGIANSLFAPGVQHGIDDVFMSFLPPFAGRVARGMLAAGLDKMGGNLAVAAAQLPNWNLALKSMRHLLGKVGTDGSGNSMETKSEAEQMVNVGLGIIGTLAQINRSSGSLEIDNATLVDQVNQFVEKSLGMEEDAIDAMKMPLNIPHRPMKPRQIRNAAEAIGQVESSASALTKNYKRRLESSAAMLRETMTNYREQVASYERVMDQTMQVVLEIQRSNGKKIEIEDVLKLLKQALVQLGKLVVAWDDLSRYFRKLADIVKVPMGLALQEFKETAATERQARGNQLETLNNEGNRGAMMGLLFNSAFKCAAISNHVYGIAAAYVNVSNGYFLPELSSLNELLGIDGGQNPQLLIQKSNEVDAKLNAAKTGVINMVRMHKDTMREKTLRVLAYYEKKISKVKVISAVLAENAELRRRRR